MLPSRILVFLLYRILLYFVRKLERSPRWRSFHVENSTFSNNNNKEETRIPRAIRISFQTENRGFFTYISLMFFFFFFHIFRRLPLTSTCVYRDEKEPRMLCTMRKINRENTLWWLVRRKGNLGQEFFDVPPHWRSEWIARVQRPPPPSVEFTDQVFRFSARKGEFLEFFHRIARTELLLMELLFYKRFFVRILSICVRPKIVLIILIVRSTLTFLLEMEEEETNPFFLHGCLRIMMLKSISVNVKIDRRQKTQIILFKYSS